MISKEEWDNIERNLSSYFGHVELKADEHLVTFELRRYSELRQCIVVFYEGKSIPYGFSGDKNADEKKQDLQRRFSCERKRFLYPKKVRDQYKGRRWTKKRLDELHFNPSVSASTYLPIWTSFKALKRHLIKNNADLSVVQIGFNHSAQTEKG